MKALLSNKSVNNTAVGFIVGFAVVSFAATVGAMVYGLLDSGADGGWEWKTFWSGVVVLVVSLLAAWVVNKQAE